MKRFLIIIGHFLLLLGLSSCNFVAEEGANADKGFLDPNYYGYYGSPFVTTWRVGANSYGDGDNSVTLPLRAGFYYNFRVDWGDGTPIAEVTSDTDPDATHVYPAAGDYTVHIDGTVETWFFNSGGDKDKLIDVPQLGDVGWKTLEGAFKGCTNLGHVGWGNTYNVTSMAGMFEGAAPNIFVELGSWDYANVTDMSLMFTGVTLSTAAYDVFLETIYQTSSKDFVTLDAGSASKYTSGTAASAARNALMASPRYWTIYDGGAAP